MGVVLNAVQRRHLDAVVQQARKAAEKAAADALHALAVAEPSRPAYLGNDQNALRLALREKARQLGDDTARGGANLSNLVREVAYEQWHRLLFARFLEANGLLRHPEFRDTSLTLDDCAELADDLGEPDGWSAAARFAAEILPGVFRLDDPAVQVRFATEHRLELERILFSLPEDVFVTEDALGWVYQFWQTAEKKRVNESGVKIGGADLSPVTQLFTENYMVRFLLENSLGAWWAARHPASPLVGTWDYLRRLDDGTPAAGTFDEWPVTAAEITVMDPCCGSGHFLVAMFGMLWRMRAEEEDLLPADAQDAVLRANVHGLELDPRCAQIATFNVALEAWKQGGFRDLPAPKIACSGVRVRATRDEWSALAGDDSELRRVMTDLHLSFQRADSLGSLIDPRPSGSDDGLFARDLSIGADRSAAQDLLSEALSRENRSDTVLGHAAEDVVHAATLLSRTYTLVATNPPFLHRSKQSALLRDHLDRLFPAASQDLATAFLERCVAFAGTGGSVAAVSPQNWLQLGRYRQLRQAYLSSNLIRLVALLGSGAFSGLSGEVVKAALTIFHRDPTNTQVVLIESPRKDDSKVRVLREGRVVPVGRHELLDHPDALIVLRTGRGLPLMTELATALGGITTGDSYRYRRDFWEVAELDVRWERQQSPPSSTMPYAGRERILLWEGGNGRLREASSEGATIAGQLAWGRVGIAVGKTGGLPCTLYCGDIFENVCAVIVPDRSDLVPAIWAFCSSPEFARSVREVDSSLGVTANTLAKIPFDLEHWQAVANATAALSPPRSYDPTQWLFSGDMVAATEPLQVALARLIGYRWPDQQPDDLDKFVDADGVAALQSLPREPDLATRMRELLAAAYGSQWSSTLERTLVAEAGGKNGRLEDWLRDTFFAQHLKVFDNRPFLWHIWDGRKDGFSAIVNYHRLDHGTLEKLTFTSLGAWIERQKHEASAGRAGADARLAAAEDLQERLKTILDGAPPHDVYVRWKDIHEQSIGWTPDLDDGVRLNIRPFVTAGVLRSKVNVHWNKDRGTNPDGSERINDLHPTLEERREARRLAGGKS